ncbi:cytosine permease [Virgibacillus halophilus]|uniref:Cytosine permease n=1 Tax=Tigheibacillus halophilus TaxID=361280 RepID=A0ABU5C2N2_9BACI|nr:cytosine permease [Virgibacillus halophilus]
MENKTNTVIGEKRTLDQSLYNSDLAPTPEEKRNWGWWSYTTLWMGIVTNLVAWEVAANLIRIGMNFWEAFGCIGVSYGLVFIVILLNGHSGAKYGIPFPVIARSIFGYKGAQITVVMRTILSIFWFGVMMYIGSKAVNSILSVSFGWWAGLENTHIIGMELNMFIAYLITWLMHAYLALHGVEKIRRFELWAGPIILFLGIGLVIWAIKAANGIKPLVSMSSTIPDGEFWGSFLISMTALIGTMSALMLNIPDLTRFSRSQKDQTIGQAIGLPIMFGIFSLMAIFVTTGTVYAFGSPITDPIELLKKI